MAPGMRILWSGVRQKALRKFEIGFLAFVDVKNATAFNIYLIKKIFPHFSKQVFLKNEQKDKSVVDYLK